MRELSIASDTQMEQREQFTADTLCQKGHLYSLEEMDATGYTVAKRA